MHYQENPRQTSSALGKLYRYAAYFFSFLLHPLVLPTAIFAFLGFFTQKMAPISGERMWLFLAFVFLMSYLFPAASTLIFYRFGFIESLSMSNRRERRLPMVVTVLVYAAISYYLLRHLNVSPVVSTVMFLITFTAGLVALINFYWKISAHMAGIGGLTGLFIVLQMQEPHQDLLPWAAGAILLSGILGSSRLTLQSHNMAQVSTGYLLGLLIAFGYFYFYLSKA